MPTVQPTALQAHPDIPAELYAQAEARTTEAFEAVKAQNPFVEGRYRGQFSLQLRGRRNTARRDTP